jgi:MFS family permease
MVLADHALVVFGVGKGKDWGWTSALTVGSFVVAGVCLALFVAQSRRHPQPLIDLTLFRKREVWMSNAANTLISVTSLAIWLVWPLYLKRLWGYSNLEIGLALTPGPIAAGVMTLVGGRVADRFGHKWPIHVGSLIMVFSVGWCWLVLDQDGSYLTSFLPGLLTFGIGWGFSSPTMNSYALEAVPELTWGSMNAAFNMLRNVAGAVGVAAAVAFVGSADRPDIVAAFDRAFVFFFVSTTLGAMVIFLFYPRSKPVALKG